MANEDFTRSSSEQIDPRETAETAQAEAGRGARVIAAEHQQGDADAQNGAGQDPVPVDPATGQPVDAAQEEAEKAEVPETVAPDENNVVRLPAGVSIDEFRLEGDNLLLVQPDGSTITILNAALNIPTFLIGDVEIPEVALIAALEANGINVAAGPDGLVVVSADSSGGNFEVPPPGIGEAGPPIDLLPPTALQFGTLERPELFAGLEEPQEALQILSIDSGDGTVRDPDLDDGGTNSQGDGETTMQVVTVQAGSSDVIDVRFGDSTALNQIVIQNRNGGGNTEINREDGTTPVNFEVVRFDDHTLEIYADGTKVGTITINFTGSIPAGDIGDVELTFNLEAAFPHDWATDLQAAILNVPIEAEDGNGFTDMGTTDLFVVDDVPTAVSDTAQSVTEGDATGIGGNVLSNDVAGADGAELTHVDLGSGFVAIDSGADQGGGVFAHTTANGTYTFQSDGTWSFVPNDNLANPADASFDYRLTDGDGDTDEATQPITVDDGAGPTGGDTMSLQLDEDDLADGSDTTKEALTTSDTLSFTAGTDDITSVVFSTDLTGLTPDGDTNSPAGAITWSRVSDTQITGSVGGTVVVTLDLVAPGSIAAGATDATTQVTMTLSDEFDNYFGDDAETLLDLGSVQVVASEADGDSATGTVNLAVVDDVPSVALSSNVTLAVDEDDLDNFDEGDSDNDDIEGSRGTDGTDSTTQDFTLGGTTPKVNFGADGKGSFGFASTAAAAAFVTSLSLTSKGFAIDDAVVSGNTVTAYASDGRAIFELELTDASDGTYEFTLLDQIDHTLANGENTLSVDVSGFIQITDGDGDSATLQDGSVTVTVTDDVPNDIEPMPSIVTNSGDANGFAGLDYFGNIGADEPGSVVFTGINGGDAETDGVQLFQTDGTTAVETQSGDPIYLFGFGTGMLVASTDPDFEIDTYVPSAPSDDVVFQVTLNPDGSVETNDQYQVEFFQKLDDGSGIDFTETPFTDPGANRFDTIDTTGRNILISSEKADGTPEKNNTSNSGGGNLSVKQNGAGIDNDEVVKFDFVENVEVFGTNFNNQYYNYDNHYIVNGFSFNINQATDSSIAVAIRAYDADDDDPAGTSSSDHSAALSDDDGTQDTITEIWVNGDAIDLGNPSVAMSDGNGGYIVFGLSETDRVSVFTADGYNRIELENYDEGGGDNDGFSVNAFGFNLEEEGDDIPMQFDVEVTDEDGDTSSGQIDVTVTPEGSTITGTSSSESLIGGSGDDTLIGNEGDDILAGGLGSDTMEGGLGADTFVIDADSLDASIEDMIVDYNESQSDVVDLTQLFTANSSDPLSDYVQVVGNELQVDTDGGANSWVTVATFDVAPTPGTINILYNDDSSADNSGTV